MEPNVVRCDWCGATPAIPVKLREITGLVIAFRVQTHERVLCRGCGTAVYRKATDNTLMKGWWGFFAFFANLWAIVANRRTAKRLQALRGPYDAERPEGPADPGPLLRNRTGVKVTAVVFVLLAVLMLVGALAEDDEYVDVDELPGKCIALDPAGGQSAEFDTVDCSGPHHAVVVGVVDRREQCSPNAEEVLQLDMVTGPDRYACLDTD